MIHKTLCKVCRPKHPSLLLDKLLEKLKTVLMLLSLPVRRLCDLCACSVPTHWTFSLWWLLYPGDYVMSDVILWHHLPSSIAPEMSISPIFEHRVITAAPLYFPCVEIQHRGIHSNMHLPTFGSLLKSVIRYLECWLLTSSLSFFVRFVIFLEMFP